MTAAALAMAAVMALPAHAELAASTPSSRGDKVTRSMKAAAGKRGYDVHRWLQELEEKNKTPSKPQAARVSSARRMPRQIAIVPACAGNDLRVGREDGVMCSAAASFCPDGGYLVWVMTTTTMQNAGPDDWEISNQRCIRPGEDPTGGRPRRVPAFTQEDFARLRLPAGGMHLQPNTGEVLINVPTNVYVTATTTTRRARLLDVVVEVEATPTTYMWTFGDGGNLVARSPGHPYPDMTTTHTYTRQGRYQVTLSTTYTGRYRIVGEPDWLPIDGAVDVASPVQTLVAYEARAVLVP